jgi:hypothetical protein
MWPFRRKRETPPEPKPAAPAPAPPAASRQAARSAEEVLRELDHETAAEPRIPGALLGQFLLAEGPLTREYVQKQLAVGGKADSYLGQLLENVRAPRESDLFDFLTASYRIPEVDLKQCKVQVAVARSVPRELVLKYRVVPVERIGDLLCVLFADQPNPKALEAIRRATGLAVKAFRCPAHHLQIVLRRLYATEAPAAAARPAPAAAAASAVPVSEPEYQQVLAGGAAASAEARWESLHASKGPVRALRLARR